MAHSGHAGGHHGGSHHHYYGGYYRGGSASWGEIIILLAILAIFIFIECEKQSNLINSMRGKNPITETYQLTEYVIEDEHMSKETFFENEGELETGLKEFYEKSGVQLVVYLTTAECDEKEAMEVYYDLFDDEYHALIIVSSNWSDDSDSDSTNYRVGDITYASMLGDTEMEYLISNEIRFSSDGEQWRTGLEDFESILFSE